jgi:sulfate permease, SulP family
VSPPLPTGGLPRSGAAARWLPFLRWWPRVNRLTLRADLVAGLTGGIVLVPQGVAFATIAGMPPEYGLYAAMLPAVVAALWGSSWHLVSGPTTAISIVVFSTISPLAVPGSAPYVQLVLTLTLLVGLIQLVLGLARLGTLVNFVSHTVVVGFTSGAAVLIAASQVKNFFGIEVARGASVWETLRALLSQVGGINPYVLATALATLLACVLVKRAWPRLPHMIVGMLVGSAVAAALNAWAGGVGRTGLSSIGALAIGLPPLSQPDFTPATLKTLMPIAVAVALLALTEAVSIARAIALQTHQRIDGNQEFIGQGLSNLVGTFFSGYTSSGSFNRSGLNYEAGAQTPLAAVFSALCLLLILLFLAPLAAYLPVAAMAGLLFVVAWGLLDWHHIGIIVRASRQELAVLLLTFIATLTLELEFAIYIGVLASLLMYLHRTSRPPVEEMGVAAGKLVPGVGSDDPRLRIARINGSIYFGAANHLQDALQDQAHPQPHLLLLAQGINFIDLAGAQLLAQEAQRRRALGGGLYLAGLKAEPLATLRTSAALQAIGADNLLPEGSDALAAVHARL